MAAPRLALDHLVVAARTLAEGVAWCEATLGVEPEAGGRHVLMGTHNRLLALGSLRFPRSYLEIVAIDPDAAPPSRSRWFDLDTAAMRAALAQTPCLVHWVARTDAIDAAAALFRSAGHDVGMATAAERTTPGGILRWRITLRKDGCRLADGAIPLLIEWGEQRPSDALPDSGVALERVELGGVEASLAAGLGVDVRPVQPGPVPPIAATLRTPRGIVELVAPGDQALRAAKPGRPVEP